MISLITATLNRIEEFERLLQSLEKQTFKNFELIVVDQNFNNELEILIDKYRNKVTIKYIKSDTKGLSHNRNIGLKYAEGDIIGFPDDDCYYDNNLLFEVSNTFNNRNPKVVLVPVHDITANRLFIKADNGKIWKKKIIKSAISFNFFIKNASNKDFDENLGVGAEFGSGEETDFLWNNMNKVDYGLFTSSTLVHHPMGKMNNHIKAYKYGLGFGAMYYKEIFKRKNYTFFVQYLKYLFRNIIAIIVMPNRRFYLYSFIGKIVGFCSFKNF